MRSTHQTWPMEQALDLNYMKQPTLNYLFLMNNRKALKRKLHLIHIHW